nr:hypothetical protein [Tanacetum cinerariifolium]
MQDLHFFVGIKFLVDYVEGNIVLRTEGAKRYREEIMNTTAPFHKFQITYLPKALNLKVEARTGLASIRIELTSKGKVVLNFTALHCAKRISVNLALPPYLFTYMGHVVASFAFGGGEHASASTPSEPATRSVGMSTTGTQSRQMSASKSAFAEEPMQTTCQMDEHSHPVFEIGAEDQPIVQTSQHPEWFSQPRKPPTSDRDWNKTLPVVQGSAQSWISKLAKQADAHLNIIWRKSTKRRRISWIGSTPKGGTSSRKYTTSVTKTKVADYGHIKWIEELVPHLQLVVESYQKRLNLTKPDTYRSDLKRREAYTAYSYPRGFIYQNKDKKIRLMRIDELHKFSDGTLNDVRNALDDRLKGIRMQHLPTTIWKKGIRTERQL